MRETLHIFKRITEIEFSEIVQFTIFFPTKLRIQIIDNSFIDVHISKKIPLYFAFHWERRHIDKTVFRYDNFPDPKWKNISTFPKHFHYKNEDNIIVPDFATDIEQGFHDFMRFVHKYIKNLNS